MYLNSPTSCPCCHVFSSLFFLMQQINRYGWTQWEEGNPPSMELVRNYPPYLLQSYQQYKCKSTGSFGDGFRHGWLHEPAVCAATQVGLCASKGPMLCCHHLDILNLTKGPPHAHFAPGLTNFVACCGPLDDIN